MNKLFTQAEFESATVVTELPLVCAACGRAFTLTKRELQRIEKGVNRARKGLYCTKRCANGAKTTVITLACTQCGKSLRRPTCRVSATGNCFCNHSCAATHANTHKTKGTRVSKLERWLQSRLIELYPTAEFHFNRTDAINAELDIYMPEIKLAFELNGVFHYEPIYGQDKLAATADNDQRKQQACNERGIALCVIDTSAQKYFKEATALPYLEIIRDVIAKHSGQLERAKGIEPS